jgi:hypothetical protein
VAGSRRSPTHRREVRPDAYEKFPLQKHLRGIGFPKFTSKAAAIGKE